jgi:hypothetical protein
MAAACIASDLRHTIRKILPRFSADECRSSEVSVLVGLRLILPAA